MNIDWNESQIELKDIQIEVEEERESRKRGKMAKVGERKIWKFDWFEIEILYIGQRTEKGMNYEMKHLSFFYFYFICVRWDQM